jgi:hypothetical protein
MCPVEPRGCYTLMTVRQLNSATWKNWILITDPSSEVFGGRIFLLPKFKRSESNVKWKLQANNYRQIKGGMCKKQELLCFSLNESTVYCASQQNLLQISKIRLSKPQHLSLIQVGRKISASWKSNPHTRRIPHGEVQPWWAWRTRSVPSRDNTPKEIGRNYSGVRQKQKQLPYSQFRLTRLTLIANAVVSGWKL